MCSVGYTVLSVLSGLQSVQIFSRLNMLPDWARKLHPSKQCLHIVKILINLKISNKCFNPLPLLQLPGEAPIGSLNVPRTKVLFNNLIIVTSCVANPGKKIQSIFFLPTCNIVLSDQYWKYLDFPKATHLFSIFPLCLARPSVSYIDQLD